MEAQNFIFLMVAVILGVTLAAETARGFRLAVFAHKHTKAAFLPTNHSKAFTNVVRWGMFGDIAEELRKVRRLLVNGALAGWTPQAIAAMEQHCPHWRTWVPPHTLIEYVVLKHTRRQTSIDATHPGPWGEGYDEIWLSTLLPIDCSKRHCYVHALGVLDVVIDHFEREELETRHTIRAAMKMLDRYMHAGVWK